MRILTLVLVKLSFFSFKLGGFEWYAWSQKGKSGICHFFSLAPPSILIRNSTPFIISKCSHAHLHGFLQFKVFIHACFSVVFLSFCLSVMIGLLTLLHINIGKKVVNYVGLKEQAQRSTLLTK